jgi:transcriptional regulator with XRE-family HTH domain
MGGPQVSAAVDPLVEELRMDRHARGIAQAWLAGRMGTTQSAISEAEAGQTSPTLTTLRRWTQALGYDLTLVRRDGG